MKTIFLTTVLAFAAIALLFSGCNKTPSLKELKPKLPATPYSYTTSVITSLGNTPINNRLTNDGATLGRVLFYDPRLSLNNSVSCATCHKQEFAFADNAVLSTGFEGVLTSRNTPPIINAISKASFFWDGRETSLESMVLMPVRHRVEMGLEQSEVLKAKIASIEYYPELFNKAFGSPEVTEARISMALAQFVRTMQSGVSRAELGQLTTKERDGQAVFNNRGCFTCHRSSNFGGDDILSSPYSGVSPVANSANIGLDVNYTDKGIMAVNNNTLSDGAFKIPTLRNIALTAPYMHDGRFATLEEVIEHYNTGVQASAQLDTELKAGNGLPKRMNMTEYEKEALAAFLRALTDVKFVNDVKFSNPF